MDYRITHLKQLETKAILIIRKVTAAFKRSFIYGSFRRNKQMRSFILIDRNSNATSDGCIILDQKVGEVPEKRYIFREESTISAAQRQALFGHNSATIWLTGLSGSGKSTIAKLLDTKLFEKGIHSYVLDGDNLRHGLNSDLGFSPEDRCENIRRAAEVARLMNDAGLVVIAAFVSPYRKDREMAHKTIGNNFIEVFVDASIAICRQRDPKGLYAKFDAGAFTGLTGVDAPYEVPQNPALILSTDKESADESVEKVLEMVLTKI